MSRRKKMSISSSSFSPLFLLSLLLLVLTSSSSSSSSSSSPSSASSSYSFTSSSSSSSSMPPIPITVVTGFLGSGKTTLIRSILSRSSSSSSSSSSLIPPSTFAKRNIALIENEFAASFGVENELLLEHSHEEEIEEEKEEAQRPRGGVGVQLKWVYEFGNGCICCSSRGEVGKALQELLDLDQQQRADYVIIETTGLSGATGSLIDAGLQEHFYLDGIITVVDAKHIFLHLDPALVSSDAAQEYRARETKSEVYEQIAVADRVVLNKIDLVTEEELRRCEEAIRLLNPGVEIIRTSYSAVPDLSMVLDIHANTAKQYDADDFAGKMHDASVDRIVVSLPGSVDLPKFQGWLSSFLELNKETVFRSKGILAPAGSDDKLVLQGVHDSVNLVKAPKPWGSQEERFNLLVLIGRDLDQRKMLKQMKELIVSQ